MYRLNDLLECSVWRAKWDEAKLASQVSTCSDLIPQAPQQRLPALAPGRRQAVGIRFDWLIRPFLSHARANLTLDPLHRTPAIPALERGSAAAGDRI